MPWNLELERIDAVIERQSLDHRLEHRPEPPAATGRSSWFHDFDPVVGHRAFRLQSNDARPRFDSFEPVSKILEKIRDREFHRFSRPDRAIEFPSY